MRVKRLLFSALLTSLLLTGCEDEPVTTLPEFAPETLRQLPPGSVQGFVDANGAQVWRGLPFASPPVGELRWHAPRPAEGWDGVRDARTFAPVCKQLAGPAIKAPEREHGTAVGSEDCLYLNVWAPSRSGVEEERSPLPVMIWIHGGGNSVGAGSVFDGSLLATGQDVIVVTINYRLGIFGWFSHPDLHNAAASNVDRSGNYGTLDTIEALRWVQTNISAFGGDPDRVTIFGESAGGRNVYGLLGSPLAAGLFHGAIAQSGSLRTDTLAQAQHFVDDKEPGAKHSSRDLLNRLLIADKRAADAVSARRVQLAMGDKATRDYLFGKTADELLSVLDVPMAGVYIAPQLLRDGVVLPAEPLLDRMRAGNYNRVPLIAGTTRDEFKVFLLGNPEYVRWLGPLPRIRDLQYFNQIAGYFSRHWKALAVDEPASVIASLEPGKVFAYRFDWDEAPRNWLVKMDEVMGASHAFELGFVFGDFSSGFEVPGLFTEGNAAGRIPLSKAMMDYWGAFAHHGDPGRGLSGSRTAWTAWSNSSDSKTILFDTDAGGGIRMSPEAVGVAEIKQQLDDVASNGNGRKACEMYAQMFLYSYQETHHWDEREYRQLGDGSCTDFAHSQFMP